MSDFIIIKMTKALNTSLLLLISLFSVTLVSASSIEEAARFLEDGYEHVKHDFGALHLTQRFDGLTHSVVYWPGIHYFEDTVERYYEHSIESILSLDEISQDDILHCSKGDTPNFWKFLTNYKGLLSSTQTSLNFQNQCFNDNTFTLTKTGDNSFALTIESTKANSELCVDTYLFATTLNFHIETVFFRGKHVVEFRDLTDDQVEQIETYGLHIFSFCDRLAYIIPDLVYTALLFLGGLTDHPYLPIFGSKVPYYQEQLNLEFLREGPSFVYEPRPNIVLDIASTEIRNGDVIMILRLDGLSPMIAYGSGSKVTHTVTALEIDGEMHIVESRDGNYWPFAGIQKNKWEDWVKYAHNADFNAVLFRLRDDLYENYNATAALEYFNSMEGLPYGFHNFIFGWIDTPDQSFPPTIAAELVPVVMSIGEKVIPNQINSIFNLAMNKRLGTENLTVPELADEISSRNLTFKEVLSMPEQDDWVYPDGKSRVCSSFVTDVLKHAGIFGDLDINSSEFHPRDVYSLNIFQKDNSQYPQACKDNKSNDLYCQLMGKYWINITTEEYNFVDPYSHMNEHCPSEPPLYDRPAGC